MNPLTDQMVSKWDKDLEWYNVTLPPSSLPQTLAATTVVTMNSLLCSLIRDVLVHQGTMWGGYATEKVRKQWWLVAPVPTVYSIWLLIY